MNHTMNLNEASGRTAMIDEVRALLSIIDAVQAVEEIDEDTVARKARLTIRKIERGTGGGVDRATATRHRGLESAERRPVRWPSHLDLGRRPDASPMVGKDPVACADAVPGRQRLSLRCP